MTASVGINRLRSMGGNLAFMVLLSFARVAPWFALLLILFLLLRRRWMANSGAPQYVTKPATSPIEGSVGRPLLSILRIITGQGANGRLYIDSIDLGDGGSLGLPSHLLLFHVVIRYPTLSILLSSAVLGPRERWGLKLHTCQRHHPHRSGTTPRHNQTLQSAWAFDFEFWQCFRGAVV